jgi:hypothetical protein
MPAETSKPCPICDCPMPITLRYPHSVCMQCMKKAESAEGRALLFTNASFSGGYEAYFADTGERYESHMCFIRGVRCHADEAHMGGIVIQVV